MTALLARPERVRLAGQRQQAIATAHFRLMVVMLLFIGVTSLIALRLVYLLAFEDRPARTASRDGLLPDR
jgi:cell division protein FtsI (penicillin-binding protein 3)